MLYTVLVSHPIQLSSRHMVGRSMGSCVSIGQLDGMGHQDWVLSLCCWTSYDRWESYTLHEQSLAILNNPRKVRRRLEYLIIVVIIILCPSVKTSLGT